MLPHPAATVFFETGFHPKPRAHQLAKIADQQAPGEPYVSTSPALELQAITASHAWYFTLVLEIQTQVLMIAQQTLHPLSHLLALRLPFLMDIIRYFRQFNTPGLTRPVCFLLEVLGEKEQCLLGGLLGTVVPLLWPASSSHSLGFSITGFIIKRPL